MDKLAFRKVELWLVGLVVVLMLIFSLFLSWLVYHRMSGGTRLSGLADLTMAVVRAPGEVKAILTGDAVFDEHRGLGSFDEGGGFTRLGPGTDPQFVLVSRYDGNIRWSVVELFQEGESEPRHRWVFDDPRSFAIPAGNEFVVEPQEGEPHTLRIVHPVMASDGRLFLKAHYGAFHAVGPCGQPLWSNAAFAYHHSTETDHAGNLWVPGAAQTSIEGQGWDHRLVDDHIVQLSPDGDVLYAKSVLEMLQKADLLNLIYDYDLYITDPIHLNDIQPVLADGKVFRRGDVLLSLGHLNMVLLFRPSEDRIVWRSQHRIMHQHDIDIIAPDVITVYDNRRKTDHTGAGMIVSANEMVRFELPDTFGTPINVEPFDEMNIRTFNQGLSDAIDGSGLMVEDTSRGRLVKFDTALSPEWIYMNRDEDGEIWTMNWSRYVPQDLGARAADALKSASCP